jgi:hypothetical protein
MLMFVIPLQVFFFSIFAYSLTSTYPLDLNDEVRIHLVKLSSKEIWKVNLQ